MADEHAYKDALPHGPVRGRGAGLNPGNRFVTGESGVIRLHVLGEHLDETRDEQPRGRQTATRTLGDETRRVLNRVDSPDLPFHWTFNPYRGCEHGCVYCYARPTHEMLGFSCGLDFETQIMVKRRAPELLRRELASPRWEGEAIAMSGVTDPYQPIEQEQQVTRRCLEVMAECRQPVGVVTKSRLVVRDLDLLRRLAAHDAVSVAISLTTLDADLARRMEPRASAPRDRLRAMSELAGAGIPVMVMIAPVIPALNDHEIPALLEAAAEAGATAAGWILLRLPHQVETLFLEWLGRHFPERAARVVHGIEHGIEDTRGGRMYDSTFGRRQRGQGARARQIARSFEVFSRRCGLETSAPPLSSGAFRRPALDGQLDLFDR